MHRPNTRRATRYAILASVAFLALSAPMTVMAQSAPPALATEFADAQQQAAITVGMPVAVSLGRGQSAYLRLPEGQGDLVAVTRRLSRNADTVMALLDAQGRVLEEDDDGGEENLASRLEIGAEQRGPLYLRVGILEGGEGRFEVMLERAPPADPNGPARTLAEAVTRPVLDVGTPVRLTLRTRQDAFFRLPGNAPDLIALTRNLDQGADTVLTLVDANGRELGTDDDGGDEQLASRVDIPGAQRRPLFLRVGALTGGSFDLVLEPDVPTTVPSFPRSLREAAAAPALVVGQPVPVRLRRGQAAVFRLPEGDIAVVTQNLRRNADTVLTLLDAEGNEIAEDDDGGGGLASRIEVAAADARPLFVRVRLLGDASGDFEIAAQPDVAEPVTFPLSLEAATQAPALQPNVAVPIRLRRGQQAYFRLPSGVQVVATRELQDGTDTVLELLDPSGQVLAEDDDGGEGLASRLQIDGARKGDLFVRASVLGNTSGAFELVVQ